MLEVRSGLAWRRCRRHSRRLALCSLEEEQYVAMVFSGKGEAVALPELGAQERRRKGRAGVVMMMTVGDGSTTVQRC
ncbi:vegetative cell wall protein gp1 [Iris pallida]|uniref:Vegetative cell wall protein gp1 n=1 Tax=Iris pallida TaxID=29817 RepID=A0AAX6FFC4_IRIPA|nr:vegetative cell wall protein gp1 [Iris pallida]